MANKIFISYSFKDRKEFYSFDKKLKNFLREGFGITAYSFVFDFNEKIKNDKELMNRALEKIDESDILIAEVSHKQIGIGVEVGYAKAKGKKIIYICRVGSDISTTVDGISDVRIEYRNIDDLFLKLKSVIA